MAFGCSWSWFFISISLAVGFSLVLRKAYTWDIDINISASCSQVFDLIRDPKNHVQANQLLHDMEEVQRGIDEETGQSYIETLVHEDIPYYGKVTNTVLWYPESTSQTVLMKEHMFWGMYKLTIILSVEPDPEKPGFCFLHDSGVGLSPYLIADITEPQVLKYRNILLENFKKSLEIVM